MFLHSKGQTSRFCFSDIETTFSICVSQVFGVKKKKYNLVSSWKCSEVFMATLDFILNLYENTKNIFWFVLYTSSSGEIPRCQYREMPVKKFFSPFLASSVRTFYMFVFIMLQEDAQMVLSLPFWRDSPHVAPHVCPIMLKDDVDVKLGDRKVTHCLIGQVSKVDQRRRLC